MSLALLLIALLAQSTTVAETSAVEGSVVRVGSSEPVPRARVLVTSAETVRPTGVLTHTDEGGRFIVSGLSPGRYQVAVDRDGYVRAIATVTLTAAARRSAQVELTPTGVITGRVVDANGTPVSRAFVTATTGDLTFQNQTDDLGEYRIFDLPPGRYVVSAAPYLAPRIEGAILIRPTPPGPYSPGEGQAMLSLSRMLQQGDYVDPLALTRERYVPAYYPGTTDATAATPLKLGPGATLTGIDVTVIRGPAATR